MKTKMPEPEIITRKGKAVSVILPIEIYQEMLERLEDADDIEWLNKARKKSGCLQTRWGYFDPWPSDCSSPLNCRKAAARRW